MAGGRLMQRIGALETAGPGQTVWLVLEPDETAEQGVARYEAKHGPRPAITWHTICTGVPRGEAALCA